MWTAVHGSIPGIPGMGIHWLWITCYETVTISLSSRKLIIFVSRLNVGIETLKASFRVSILYVTEVTLLLRSLSTSPNTSEKWSWKESGFSTGKPVVRWHLPCGSDHRVKACPWLVAKGFLPSGVGERKCRGRITFSFILHIFSGPISIPESFKKRK